MNITTVKKAVERVEFPSVANLGILAYGKNNLYPQELKNLVGSSDSASSCLRRYVDFIEGWGFADVKFSETQINFKGETADDVQTLIADDVANYSGLALHVNYNLLGQIVEIQHVPFENCRLTEPDENGDIKKIAVHIDWTGKTKRGGKFVRVEKKNIDYINVFNPAEVLTEIESCGGIANYKGQILYVSSAGLQAYPTPRHDSVISYLSTENALGNISNRNSENGFMPGGILFINESKDTVDNNTEGVQLEIPFNKSVENDIALIKNSDNTNSIAIIRPDYNVDEIDKYFKFLNLKGNNYDKDFTETTKTSVEKIYAGFNQEVFYRIRSGSMGFSTEIMSQAYEYYSTVTDRERRMIERAFDKIMKHWTGEVFTDFTIKPLKFIVKISDVNSLISLYEKNIITLNNVLTAIDLDMIENGDRYLSDMNSTPLAVRLGVGGTQSLTAIISDTTLSDEQKISTLVILFELSEEKAKRMIYGNTSNDGK